jgi:hypothetical protein
LLSTIATGLLRGGVKVRPPGLAVVQVEAGPVPKPLSTTVQVAGIPEEKLSLSGVVEIVPVPPHLLGEEAAPAPARRRHLHVERDHGCRRAMPARA